MGSLYVDSSVEEVRADGKSLTLYADGKMTGRGLERILTNRNEGAGALLGKAAALLEERPELIHVVRLERGQLQCLDETLGRVAETDHREQ